MILNFVKQRYYRHALHIPLIALAVVTNLGYAAEIHLDVRQALNQSRNAADSSVAVIVNLKEQAALKNGSADALAAYAAEITQVRETVLTHARGVSLMQDVMTYSHVPAIAMKADEATIDALAAHPDVHSITADLPVEAHLSQARTVGNVTGVHNSGYLGANSTVAVLDTGIYTSHADFTVDNAIVAQFCGLSSGCPAAPNVAQDGHGHGTHVAGMITRNSNGIAPNAKIAAVKVLADGGSSSGSSVVNGLNWVLANHATHNIRVVNMSLGGGKYLTRAACDAGRPADVVAIRNLRAAGVITFASTGNDAYTDGISGPACVTGAVAVGSTADATHTLSFSNCTDNGVLDKVSCYSNANYDSATNSSMVGLLAPGCLIESTNLVSGTTQKCGTSMSSPFAAAVAATLVGREQGMTPDDIENRLKSTGTMLADYRYTSAPASSYRFPRVHATNAHASSLATFLAPANDNVANPIDVSTYPKIFNEGKMAYATRPTSDPVLACRPVTNNIGNHSVWYRIQSPERRVIGISSAGSTGQVSDTMIGVYQRSGSVYTSVACNDDVAGTALARLSYVAEANAVYWVMVTTYQPLTQGTAGNLKLEFTTGLPPDNDLIAAARVIPAGSTTYTNAVNNAHFATASTTDPGHTCLSNNAGYNTVWWTFTPTLSGTITNLSTTASGAYADTVLSVYQGASSLTSIACNDNDGAATTSRLSNINVVGGTQYRILVSAKSELAMTPAGEVSLNMSFAPSPRAEVTGAPLAATIGINSSTNRNLGIRNTTGGTLNWTITESSDTCATTTNVAWLSATPVSGSLAQSATPTNIAIGFNSTGLTAGTYTAALCLNSNDPTSPTINVPVTLTVREVEIAAITQTVLGQGIPQSIALSASGTGTTSPYSYAIASGTPPNGMTLSGNGVLSGTPSTIGAFTFNVRATDSTAAANGGPFTGSRSITLNVVGPEISVTGGPISAIAGTDRVVTRTFGVRNVSGGMLNWTLAKSSSDCSITSNVSWLSATPTSGNLAPSASVTNISVGFDSAGLNAGTYTAALCVNSNDTNAATVTVPVSFIVREVEIAALTQTDLDLDAPASISLSATGTGTTAPYSYSITSGAAPTGMTLASNGTLSGTPTAAGAYTFTVRATDSTSAANGGPFTGTRSITLNVIGPQISVTGGPVQRTLGIDGALTTSLTLSNSGRGSLEWNLADDPTATTSPSSLTEGFDDIAALASKGWLSARHGAIENANVWSQGSASRFVAKTGTATSFVAADFSHANPTDGSIDSWLITPAVQLDNGSRISFWTRNPGSTTWPDRLEVRMSENANVQGTTDFSNVLLSVNPSLTATGYPSDWTRYEAVISGLDQPISGRIGFRYAVTDAGALAPNSHYIGIDDVKIAGSNTCYAPAEVSWLSVSPAAGTIAASQSATMTLSLNAQGLSAGTYTTELCIDSNDEAQARTLVPVSVEVQTLDITPIVLTDAVLDTSYSETLSASSSGSTGPYTFATVDSLPPGLSLANNGVISGTPTTLGTWNFAVRAVDSTLASAGGPFSGTINYSVAVQLRDLIFEDGFEGPLLGALELSNKGTQRVALPVTQLIELTASSGREMELFDLHRSNASIGTLFVRCMIDHCEFRVVSAKNPATGHSAARWTVGKHAQAIEIHIETLKIEAAE